MPEEAADKRYSIASLFAGMGGICKAFTNVGFRVAWANEIDPFAAQTYKHNFPDVRLFVKSISDLSVVPDKLDAVDVLTAGFPCQPFSVAGNRTGFKDPRGILFFDIVRIIREFGNDRPKILLFENVKNILYHNSGKTFTRIVNEIQALGYWFNENNAAVLSTNVHTDIPQIRERAYMVALSWDVYDYNDFKFPEKNGEPRAAADFLDIDKPADPEYYFDESTKYGKLFAESMSAGNPESIYQLRRWYVRELKNFKVPTLTANMGEGGHNKPVIKDSWGIRNLTPTECLRLQGFDHSFSFPESLSKTQQYKQIGNSVTVPLVELLARECLIKLESAKGGAR